MKKISLFGFLVCAFLPFGSSTSAFQIGDDETILMPGPMTSDDYVIRRDSFSPELRGLIILPSCGNGDVNVGEVCDGSNFDGKTCSDFGFTSGTLRCDQCVQIDTNNCSSEAIPSSPSPSPKEEKEKEIIIEQSGSSNGGGSRDSVRERFRNPQPIQETPPEELKDEKKETTKDLSTPQETYSPLPEFLEEEEKKMSDDKLQMTNDLEFGEEENGRSEDSRSGIDSFPAKEDVWVPQQKAIEGEKILHSAPSTLREGDYEYHLRQYQNEEGIVAIDPTPLLAGTLEPDQEYSFVVFSRWNEVLEKKNIWTNTDGLFVYEIEKPLEDGEYSLSIYQENEEEIFEKVREYSLFIREKKYDELHIIYVADKKIEETNFEETAHLKELSLLNTNVITGKGKPFRRIFGYFEEGKYVVEIESDKNGRFQLSFPENLSFGKQEVHIIQESYAEEGRVLPLQKDVSYTFEHVPSASCITNEKEFDIPQWILSLPIDLLILLVGSFFFFLIFGKRRKEKNEGKEQKI